jgi:putative endonuclease
VSNERHPNLGVVPAKAGTHNPRTLEMPYYVYILASGRHGTLYIGVTNDLRTRLEQHRLGFGSAFVRKYSIYRLVYVESYERAEDAIRREKQIKKWNRDWKIQLIEKDNLEWRDLSDLIT